jgi:hypothetical protein
MQQETPTIPHVWILLSNAVTAILTFAGTLTALWYKRKREPAEVRKIDAETNSLKIATEISPVGITLETLREIQVVIQKAENRREEWLLREDQMRTQIIFWRNKAEELDGQLIDSREANGLLQTRYNLKKDELDRAMALLKIHHISYSEADQPRSSE